MTVNGNNSESVYIKQIENLLGHSDHLKETIAEQLKQTSVDIAKFYADAKACGLDTKAMRAAIRVRRIENKLPDRDSYDIIRHALGDLVGTPLGDAALPPPKIVRPKPSRIVDLSSDVTGD